MATLKHKQRRTYPLIAGGAPTIEEIEARQVEIERRVAEIDTEFAGRSFDEPATNEWNSLNEEREENEKLLAQLYARRDRLREIGERPASREPGSMHFDASARTTPVAEIWDMTTLRSFSSEEAAQREMRDRVMRAAEVSRYPHERADKATIQEHVERLLNRWADSPDDLARFARRILTTGSPGYSRAFGRAIAGRTLTADEQRQLSNADAEGGYAVPFVLDPTVIPVGNSSVNPYRNICRVETVTTDTWKGVTATAITASYAADSTETSDNKPTIGQPAIDVEKAQAFIPFTIEIGQDWGGMQGEMAMLLQDAKDDLEADKFTLGVGVGSREPYGLMTGVSGASLIPTANAGAFVIADLYKVEAALPARFRPRAQWVANRSTYQLIRQFDTAGGAQFWTDLGSGLEGAAPTQGNIGKALLGFPANECSAMDTSIAKSKMFLTIGDFRYFVIVDRIGLNVELIPHLFGAVSRFPTGERGLYAYWRNSSKVVSANAFRTLQGNPA